MTVGRASRAAAPAPAEGPQPRVPADIKMQPSGLGSKKTHKRCLTVLIPCWVTHRCPGHSSSTNTTARASQTGFPVLVACSGAVCGAAFQQLSALRSPTPPSAPGLTGSGAQSTIPRAACTSWHVCAAPLRPWHPHINGSTCSVSPARTTTACALPVM